jgi:hypothetical protein
MSTSGNQIVGAVAGALICAVARFAVTLGFAFYVSQWGGRWWNGGASIAIGAVISGLIGLPVGAVAGVTCNPLMGTALGGAGSSGWCLWAFVLPAELMIALSHPGGFDRIETVEVVIGFIAMAVAGAVAGGCGAAIGKYAGGPDAPLLNPRRRKSRPRAQESD